MKFLTGIKTLILEVIGLFGGLFWYYTTPSWEPKILIISSFVGMVLSTIFIFISINKKKSDLENNSGNNLSGNSITGDNNVITQHIITNHNNGSKSQPIQIATITPAEIREKINKTSPFLKETVISSFVGLNIKWILEYYSINPLKKDKVRITMFSPTPNINIVHVSFVVNLNSYPILKIAGPNELFEVTGRITNMSSTSIEIELFDLVKYDV